MAPLGASPFRPKSRGARRTPSPPPLPPKMQNFLTAPSRSDLGASTTSHMSSGSDVDVGGATRRAVLCDVVVERPGEETAALLAQLGGTLGPDALRRTGDREVAAAPAEERSAWEPSRRDEMALRLQQLTEELLRTERSYVSRIEALQKYYASPLRLFAKQGNTVIIQKYHATKLFANIDAVLPAAQTLLADLEKLYATGQVMNALGDLCLRHLKTLRTLEPYRTYIGNQDEAQKIFQELYKNDKSFVQFVDSTKHQTTGIGNIGLRELLMEPVQRIPRYTMLWQSIAKCLPVHSEERSKLLESIDLASRIARCEADEQTVRATVMYCLQRNIDGIPASLFSNHRNFIDSIDVEELFGDGGSMRGGTTRSHKSSTSLGGAADLGVPLHCTLFLFDDQLVIAKRPSAQVSGRKLTGLDDISKLVKSGGGVAVKEKDGVKKERLSFRGAMDIMALTGLDMGSGDFQLVFDGSTPGAPVFTDQTDKWTGRAVRTYGTIHPPAPIGLNPTLARTDKERFLANLWTAQALARTRTRHKIFEPICRALVAEDDVSVESMAVKAYWNLWDRASWTATERKVKVVIQLTEDENVPELHLPQEGGPLLIIRVEALSGAVCKVQALTPAGHEVLRTATSVSEINDKIIEAINDCDLFKVRVSRTGSATPSGGTLFSKRASRLLWGNSMSGRDASVSSRTHSSTKSRSLDVRSSSDLLTLSSVTSYPKTPRSERSPISPTSPAGSDAPLHAHGYGNGHSYGPAHGRSHSYSRAPIPFNPFNMPEPEPDSNAMNLNELVKSPKNANLAMSGASPTAEPPISRVAAMRQQLERRAHEEEMLAPTSTSPGRFPPRSPDAERLHRRVPVPPVATANLQPEHATALSRESSLNSQPASPRGLSRANTVSPRGPRPRTPGPVGGSASVSASASGHSSGYTSGYTTASSSTVGAPRNGYVPPLPPPASTVPGARQLPMLPGAPAALGSFGSLAPTPSFGQTFAPSPALSSAPSVATQSLHTSMQSHRGHSVATEVEVEVELASDIAQPQPQQEMEELDEKPEMLRILEAGRRQPSAGIGLGAPPRRINDENTPPGAMRATSAKRMYDDDGADSQRKRSASGTSSIMACVDSGSGSGPGSGATSTLGPRRVSSRARGRVVSATSLRRDDDGDIAMSEHADLVSAAASARARIAAARNLARQIRADGVALRSLPGTHSRTPSGSILERGRPIPARDRDELSRAIVLGGDELESALADALADAERVKMFAAEAELVHPSRSQAPAQAAAEEAAAAAEAYEATITTMEGQLQRAKEREELLADQLRRRDLELEEIYNAFNAELDGMYNDMTLPRADGVVAALRQDVAAAKAARNTADLENRRLKLQIEEEKLKREQWSQLLHARGLL